MATKRKPTIIAYSYSRRRFLKISGSTALTFGIGGLGSLGCTDESDPNSTTDDLDITPDGGGDIVIAIEASQGFLLVDAKKCQGCLSCMLACSLCNEGVENLSKARLQIMQNSFEKWPDDLSMAACRQCTDPKCLHACPYNAINAKVENGFVRTIDEATCVGCGQCVTACPYMPTRPMVYPNAETEKNHSNKCELCLNAPYHFADEGGGPNGKQACIEVCPVGAIAFTSEEPVQDGDDGYQVNLRDEMWEGLGYPKD